MIKTPTPIIEVPDSMTTPSIVHKTIECDISTFEKCLDTCLKQQGSRESVEAAVRQAKEELAELLIARQTPWPRTDYEKGKCDAIAEIISIIRDDSQAHEVVMPQDKSVTDECRRKFEDWFYNKLGHTPAVDDAGAYIDYRTRDKWSAWQAAYNRPAKTVRLDVDGVAKELWKHDDIGDMQGFMPWDNAGKFNQGKYRSRAKAICEYVKAQTGVGYE